MALMEKVLFPPALRKERELGETLIVGVVPAWVTAMVWEATPVPETVILAVRLLGLVLASQVRVMVPALVPLEVLKLSQSALSDSVQLVLEVMDRV